MSYKITSLVSQYIEGTRQWLYKEIYDWVAASTTSSNDDKSSRMFLLMAGPVRQDIQAGGDLSIRCRIDSSQEFDLTDRI